MLYKFNDYGWYDGETESDIRSTNIAPDYIPPIKIVGETYPNWINSEWIMLTYYLPPPPTPINPIPPDPRIWWITVGAFIDRLDEDAPAIAASNNRVCRGVAFLIVNREYIDLKDIRTLIVLNKLISSSQPSSDPFWPGSGPMTPAKRDVILNTPTTENERYIKGLVPPPPPPIV